MLFLKELVDEGSDFYEGLASVTGRPCPAEEAICGQCQGPAIFPAFWLVPYLPALTG